MMTDQPAPADDWLNRPVGGTDMHGNVIGSPKRTPAPAAGAGCRRCGHVQSLHRFEGCAEPRCICSQWLPPAAGAGERWEFVEDAFGYHRVWIAGVEMTIDGAAVVGGTEALLRAWSAILAAHAKAQRPIPMLIVCPECHLQHLDEGEWATRPHKTHLCAACGNEWRPANVYTVGIRALLAPGPEVV